MLKKHRYLKKNYLTKKKINWSTLNELEMTNDQINSKSFSDASHNWIQIDKQTSRPNYEFSSTLNEDRWNNYKLKKEEKSKTHDFESYTVRKEVFPPKHSPDYNLLIVNYDRLLER